MKSFIAAAVAASFLGAMSIAQAGVPAAQPNGADAPVPVQSDNNQSAPAVPGAAGAQSAASESAKMAAMVGGLIVVSGIAIAAMNNGGGNSHQTSPSGPGGTTGTTGTTGTN